MRPPRLAEGLLRRILVARDRDYMLGDLAEQYRRHRVTSGPLRAGVWYWGEVLGCIAPSLKQRLSRDRPAAREGPPPRAADPGSGGDSTPENPTRSARPGRRRAGSPRRHWTAMFDSLHREVRHALRSLSAEPGWTAATVLTLTLAIGATTAIFTVVDSILLEPLPFPDSERLMAVGTWDPQREHESWDASYPIWDELRRRQDVFEELAVWGRWQQTVLLGGRAEQLDAAQVSATLFPTLGVEPVLGRGLTPADDLEGAAGVLLLSHGLWQRRFGGDRGILGRTVTVDERPHTIVGVMPRGFDFPSPEIEYWTSMAHAPRSVAIWYLRMAGRLRPGLAPTQAIERLSSLEFTVSGDDRFPDRTYRGRAEPLHANVVGDVRSILLIFMAAVGAVLLIACINVVNLMLTRAAGRERERSVRAALGASRWRLAAHTLAESVTVSLSGAALGLLLAVELTDVLVALSPVSVPRQQEIGLDGGVLAFTAVLAVGVGVLVGLLPAVRGAGVDPVRGLQHGRGSEGRAHQRLRKGLVVAQLALAVVLLFSGGLLLRSFAGLLSVERGFDVERVLTFSTSLPSSRYPDHETRAALYGELLDRLEGLPAVETAALAHVLPYGGKWVYGLSIDGYEPGEDESPTSEMLFVTPDFFDALSIPVLEGRSFRAGETGVTVINRTLARRYFPDRRPLGASVTFGGNDPVRVVGVVNDTRYVELGKEESPQAYLPYAGGFAGDMQGVVRTSGEPLALAGPVQEILASRDPEIAVSGLMTLDERLWDSVAEPRFRTLLLGTFGVAALLLSAVGVYGVMAYAVTRRTRELGIRMALGADRRRILATVAWQGLALTLLGLVLGAAGAWASAGLLESYLFAVRARDPLTFAGVVLVLSAVALTACWIPARRAARVDPMVALQSE